MKEITFKAEDGKEIKALVWEAETPRAVLQIIHGMAEHIERYDEFARFLNGQGISVAGEDHRGHGKTAGSLEAAGYFDDEDGWNKVLSDNVMFGKILRESNPDLPLFLFGHSMGSFLSRKIIAEYPEGISKVILSGSGDFSSFQLNALSFLGNLQAAFLGKKAKASLLNKLSFAKMNDQFSPGRTGFEWLSRDEAKVDEYVADPFCGFLPTIGFYLDFAGGLKYLKTAAPFKKTPKSLPILFYSGDRDPVGGNGVLVSGVAESYRKEGFEKIELHLNKEGRHESLNETNRTEVYRFLSDWLLKS